MRLFEGNLRHELVRELHVLGEPQLDEILELADGADGQGQHHREQFPFLQDIQHLAVLAGFALSIRSAAETVMGTLAAVAAGIADTGFAVKGTTVGRIRASLISCGVIGKGRMAVEDNSHNLRRSHRVFLAISARTSTLTCLSPEETVRAECVIRLL